VKLTPFHERTAALNRQQMWFNWDRHIVPDVYTDVREELRATRQAASMGDMSPLSKYVLRGPDAAGVLDRIVTRDVAGLDVGQVVYTSWTDEAGKVVGDGLVFRTGAEEFRLTADPQLVWLTRHVAGADVLIDDVTDAFGLLAVQGPRSRDVMRAVTGSSWDDLEFSRTRTTTVVGAEVLVSRQGFTGEIGFELWVPAASGVAVWDEVAAAGAASGIHPVGEYAIDLARVEAGLLIVGADYTGAGPDRPGSMIELSPGYVASPFEIGLGSFVDLGKPGFIGRDALVAESADGSGARLVGLELDREAIVRLGVEGGTPAVVPSRVWWYPLEVRADGRSVGRATSVTWAPTVGRVVGFGHLPADLSGPGTEVTVRWTLNGVEGDVPATVVDLPFLELRRTG